MMSRNVDQCAPLLPGTLPPGTRAALEDLFMRDRGPALRAVYAHGAVGLMPRDGDGSGGGGWGGGGGQGLTLVPISAQLELFRPRCHPTQLMNVSGSCSS